MRLHRIRALVVGASAVGLLAAAAAADTIRVPGDFDTIGEAVAVAGEGDKILVGPGTYDEFVVVDGIDRLQILGRGSPEVTGTGGAAAFVVRNCEGVRVSGFLVQGGATGVFVQNAVGTRLEKIEIVSPTGSGIQVNGCDGTLVKGCTVSGAGQPGVSVQNPAGVRVEKCVLTGGNLAAVQVSAPPTVRGTYGFAALVQKNRISAIAGSGIETTGAGVLVAKNSIDGAALDSIRCDSPAAGGCVVEKNRITNGGGAGIVLMGQEVAVEKNRLTGGTVGIQVMGMGSHAVEKNGLSVVQGDGIFVATQNNLLSGNTVTGATGQGFNVQETGNSFVKNKASGSGGFDLSSSVPEAGNTFDRNKFGTTSFP